MCMHLNMSSSHLIKPLFPIIMTDVVLNVKADSVKPFLSVPVVLDHKLGCC